MYIPTTTVTALLLALPGLVYSQTPPGFTPSTTSRLEVTYGTKSITTPGTSFTKAETSKAPTIGTTTPLPQNGTYLYFLIDVDVPANFQNPSAGARRTNLHALIAGYKPSATADANGTYPLTSSSTGPITYTGPAPPAENPPHPHKYVSLLFAQPEGAKIERAQVGQTFGFDIVAFVKKTGLSEPVAGNWLEVVG
ncbi:phosphatidylethanolamine-binding protein [Cladorrhinum samala]|uniref:Phosphatidylethanolamine-binding protein n=1 Tax=Cladorrhinum samala TaxID=585594 RepID=A0AAV9I0E1_9PEZI|nr:phosphatidylethanolamine-binding protein [Cladorrhinum samala]